MGWSPGLNSIHPGSTSEAPIGLIKKTNTMPPGYAHEPTDVGTRTRPGLAVGVL